jgi:hypothetical protein
MENLTPDHVLLIEMPSGTRDDRKIRPHIHDHPVNYSGRVGRWQT